jgi:hypothetical protein
MEIEIVAGTGDGKTAMARFIAFELSKLGIEAIVEDEGDDSPTSSFDNIKRLHSSFLDLQSCQIQEIKIITKQAIKTSLTDHNE